MTAPRKPARPTKKAAAKPTIKVADVVHVLTIKTPSKSTRRHGDCSCGAWSCTAPSGLAVAKADKSIDGEFDIHVKRSGGIDGRKQAA
jgi:hypothetical protein